MVLALAFEKRQKTRPNHDASLRGEYAAIPCEPVAFLVQAWLLLLPLLPQLNKGNDRMTATSLIVFVTFFFLSVAGVFIWPGKWSENCPRAYRKQLMDGKRRYEGSELGLQRFPSKRTEKTSSTATRVLPACIFALLCPRRAS